MTPPAENPYSRRYEIDSVNGICDKIAENSDFKEICGKAGDSLLVRGEPENLFLIERKNNKEILKIHSNEPKAMQSKLESITGINLSQYRVH